VHLESRPSLLQDPWSVLRCTPIPSGLGSAARGPHRMRYVDGGSNALRKLPFTWDMVAQAIIYHRARRSVGEQLVALAFWCGFSRLLRASEYLKPSGIRLSRHCILVKHLVFQYRTVEGAARLVSGAELRFLQIPYSMIRRRMMSIAPGDSTLGQRTDRSTGSIFVGSCMTMRYSVPSIPAIRFSPGER
jgi:hypothetical protein